MRSWRALPARVTVLVLVAAAVVCVRIAGSLRPAPGVVVQEVVSNPVSAPVVSLAPTVAVATDAKAATDALPDQRFTYHVGGPDGRGNVLFATWNDRATIYLLSDYGFMLVNAGTEQHPKPAYLLGFLNQKKVVEYKTFAGFERGLRAIPKGSRVWEYTVCTTGTAPGVDGKVWDRVQRAFRKAHLKFDPDDQHLTYDICGEGADPLPDALPEMKAAYVRVYGKAAYEQHLRHDSPSLRRGFEPKG